MDDNSAMINRAKELVVKHHNFAYGKDLGFEITADNVFIVWFCKTLQHWKALVSTDVPDQIYYEITYNGDAGTAYVDVYKKKRNYRVKGDYWELTGGGR